MSQRIDYTDGTKMPITLADGEINTTLDVGLIGKNVKGFGEQINENFLHLLENFASPTPPLRPIEGELWFDNANNRLMQYTAVATWKPVSGTRTEPRDPTAGEGEISGDIWVNTSSLQIFIYLNSSWMPIFNADATTRWVSRERRDTSGILHKTLEAVVNNRTVAVFSGDTVSWTPNSTGSLAEYLADGAVMATEYPEIRLGMNLINRKNIPDVTVNNGSPVTGTYTQIGDFWINPLSKNIFVYTSQGWQRTSGSVTVSSSAPASNAPGELGDFWIDAAGSQLYFYNVLNGNWEGIIVNTVFSEESPSSSNVLAEGNYWVNVTTEQLFVYTGTEWINLSPTTKTTGIRTVYRLDSLGVSHELLECYVQDKIVMAISSDEEAWEPADTELVDNGESFLLKFPMIYPGVNILGYLLADLVAGDIVATEAQALAGVANDVVMTPLRTRQYIDSVIGPLIPDPDDPQEETVPVQAGTFLNYRSSLYSGQVFPTPSTTYLKYLEAELEGDHGTAVKLEVNIHWSNWIFDTATETVPILEFQVKKVPEGVAESAAPVVAVGALAPPVVGSGVSPLSISDTQVYRTQIDTPVVLMVAEPNSPNSTGKVKYVLEVRLKPDSGGGSNFVYYAWMTASHMNFTVTYGLSQFIEAYNP